MDNLHLQDHFTRSVPGLHCRLCRTASYKGVEVTVKNTGLESPAMITKMSTKTFD